MIKNLLHHTNQIIILLAFVGIAIEADATVYSTIASGSWNSNAVWSTDGVSPCSCAPGNYISGDTVIVRHDVTLSNNITFGPKSFIQVLDDITVSGEKNLTVNGGILKIWGAFHAGRVDQNGASSSIELHAGVLTTTDKYVLNDGNLALYNGFLQISGNFTNYNGEIYVMHTSKLDVIGGSFNNEGYVYINYNSCISSQGAWNNYNIIEGDGSATSSVGSFDNDLTFSSSIAWYAPGGGVGMPTPANPAATGTCFGIVLPVELVEFKASANNNFTASIQWSTASEDNASHFNVLKLNETTMEWEVISTELAVGNSTELNSYSTRDAEMNKGIKYYKLEQVDMNGIRVYSDVVSVDFSKISGMSTVYPNPVQKGKNLVVTNIQSGDIINLMNVTGQNVYSNEANNQDHVVVSAVDMTVGIYFLQIRRGEDVQSIKVVITE